MALCPSAAALLGLSTWQLMLTGALGAHRVNKMLKENKSAQACESEDESPGSFGNRLLRARDEGIETLPLFGSILFAAHMRTCPGHPAALRVMLHSCNSPRSLRFRASASPCSCHLAHSLTT